MRCLFTNNSTLIHLYIDETKVTIEGLLKLLKSLRTSLKVRTISVKKCGLVFQDRAGDEFI